MRKERTLTALSTRWAVWFVVEGDARFLSHHDMMRLMERAAARAELPLKYSQGFNPRPRLSLALPRPVGVSSRCELLVLEFATPESGSDWARRLSEALPDGIDVQRAEALPAGSPPRVTGATYELPIDGPERARIEQRIESLRRQDRWEITRETTDPRRRRAPALRTIDIKGRVGDLGISGDKLTFTILAGQSGSARPAEVLALLGPTPEQPLPRHAGGELLARLTRTGMDVQYQQQTE